MSERIGKYLTAEKMEKPDIKTEVWAVYGEDADRLGLVKWDGSWWQYTFQPEALTVFHAGCLHDLAAFVTKMNTRHREERRARRGR